MAKRKRRKSLSELAEFVQDGFDMADSIGGPVVRCVAYRSRKGKKGVYYRCAKFMPSNEGGVVEKESNWVDWDAIGRSRLKRPNVYSYKGTYINIAPKKRGRKKGSGKKA